jgi:hypothetical protein
MVCFGQGFSLMPMYMLASLPTYGGDRGNKNLAKVVFLLCDRTCCGKFQEKLGLTKAQSQSYIANPPTDAVVGGAGGNLRNPCEHCLPHEMVVVSDNLMNAIPQGGELMTNYQQVLALCATCTTHKEIQEKHLFTACGSLGSVLNDICCVFKLWHLVLSIPDHVFWIHDRLLFWKY